ncbi:MAG TPA: TonB-dependent receptor, partial [Verrucomicrobiae bacterium]|nr:TonB-dependent receptor [Verrucomicrobiae bacterium]
TFKRIQVRDSFSVLAGKHAIKFGGEWLHSNNSQVFRGFFTGRYIFDSVLGFLHYASPASLGPGFGPGTGECPDGSFTTLAICPNSPLLLYLQHAALSGPTTDAAGFSDISNNNYALFIQDKWQIRPNLSLDYGLRWEAQIFPDPVVAPALTAYGSNLSDPRFPSNGKIPNATKMFQPRLGIAWDVRGNGKSAIRASWGIYNAQQNMLTQVGAITTNGVQQQTIFSGDVPGGFVGATGFDTPGPTWPGVVVPTGVASNPGVTVFDKNYNNPRTYIANFGYTQELAKDWAGYIDLTWSKGVYLTRFVDPNSGTQLTGPAGVAACTAVGATLSASGVCIPTNGDLATYPGPVLFPNLGSVTDTQSSAHSLYRGFTIGTRKRFGKGFQMEANYVLSEDLDDDSNERDPFTFRYFNKFDFRKDYTFSDRDSRHKFNMIAQTKLPLGFEFSGRIQAHTAQPITDNPLGNGNGNGVGAGAPCSPTNSITRVVNGIDCGRNHLRKDNGFFTFDWRGSRPFHFGDRYALTPTFEMFNSFNNRNNVNPLVTPGLFNFDGFLRQGVGDPLQAQLAVKFTF